ncbi:hypothetical protein HK098_006055 [Nowakowskiella sp. JEL0407]|nr:hypothetical protein HK098_006055 [Nowakowskiella sp. JEL0407]
MTFYALDEKWAYTCDTDEIFNRNSLLLIKLPSDLNQGINGDEEDVVITGSLQGKLRVFSPFSENTLNKALEFSFKEPILQLESGQFWTQQIMMGVLCARSFMIFEIIRKDGFIELINHCSIQLNENAFNFTFGKFGTSKDRDLVCIQTLNGKLTFIEKDSIVFEREIGSSEYKIGPIAYIKNSDLILVYFDNAVHCYSFQNLAISGEKAEKNILWKLDIPEILLQVYSSSFLNIPSQTEILLIGTNSIFLVSNQGVLLQKIQLDRVPICCSFIAGSGDMDSNNLMISYHDGLLATYKNLKAAWASKTKQVPIAITNCKFGTENLQVLLYVDGKTTIFGKRVLSFADSGIRSNIKNSNTNKNTNESNSVNPFILTSEICSTPTHFNNNKPPENLKKSCTIRLYLIISDQASTDTLFPITNISVSILSPKCFNISKNYCLLPNVTGLEYSEKVEIDVFFIPSSIVYSTQIEITVNFTTNSSVSQSIMNKLDVPLTALGNFIYPKKEYEFKFSVEVIEPITLTELYSDVSEELQSILGKGAIGFCFVSGAKVSVLSSKSGSRFRIQSMSVESIWTFLRDFIARIELISRTMNRPELSVSSISPLPLDTYLNIVENHIQKRKLLQNLQKELDQSLLMFRGLQKTLFMQLSEVNQIVPKELTLELSNSYNEILNSVDTISEKTSEFELSAMQISALSQLILLIFPYTFEMKERDSEIVKTRTQIVCDVLSPDSWDSVLLNGDSSSAGYEEMVESSCKYMMRMVQGKAKTEMAVCKFEADYLYYRILAADSTRNVFWDVASIAASGDWKQCFIDNIGKASLVILLISKKTLFTFNDTEDADNLLLEWDIAVARHLDGKLKILPVFVLDPEELEFDFSGFPLHTTIAGGCTRSFKEIWLQISKINGLPIHFSHTFDLEALDTRINNLIPILAPAPAMPSANTLTVYSGSIKKPLIFVGREETLSIISQLFSDTSQSGLVIIHGGPGMGKTTIASKFVSNTKLENQRNYTHIFWISLVSEFTFQSSVKDCSSLLNIPQKETFEKLRDEVFNWFTLNKNFLIVFDNADDSDVVKKCLGKISEVNGHVLITSRNKVIDDYIPLGIEPIRKLRIELEVWTTSVTREYINSRLQSRPLTDSDEEALTNILEIINGYPLVVEQMCSFLTTVHTCTFASYHHQLVSKNQRIWDQSPATGASHYGQTLDSAVKIAIKHLKKKGQKAACVLLGAMGCVSNYRIPKAYLQQYLFRAGIKADIDESLSPLLEMSLVTSDIEGDSLSIHLATQSAIRRTLPSTFVCNYSKYAITVIKDIFPQSSNHSFKPSTLIDGTVLLSHICELYYTTPPNRNTNLASLLHDAGYFACYVGSYDIAQTLYTHSQEIYSKLRSTTTNRENLATTINNLGKVETHRGNHTIAKKLFTETLSIYEKLYRSNNHIPVANTLSNLGDVVFAQGDYTQSEKLFTQSLKIKTQIYGTRVHADTAQTIRRLGDVAKRQGDYTHAEQLYLECLQITDLVYNTRCHKDVGITLTDLGDIAFIRGEYNHAGDLYLESLDVFDKIYKTRWHDCSADTIRRLGDVAKRQGDYKRAEELYSDCLEIFEKVYTTRVHTSVAIVLTLIGDVKYSKGEFRDAEELFMESLSTFEKVYGTKQHNNCASTVRRIADVARVRGDYKRAEELYLECLEIFERFYSTRQHDAFAFNIRNLGLVKLRQEEYRKATDLFNESVALFKAVYGTFEHIDVAYSKDLLGDAARMQGDYGKAERYYNEAMATFTRVHGTRRNIDAAPAINSLGVIARSKGKFEEAVELHKESLDIYQKVLGEVNHPEMAETLFNFGETYEAMGDFENASFRYGGSLKMYENMFHDQDHPFFVEVLKTLNDLKINPDRNRLETVFHGEYWKGGGGGLLISKATIESFKDDEREDNVLLEWDIAMGRYLENKVTVIPLFLLKPEQREFDFKHVNKQVENQRVLAKDCARSLKVIWEEIGKINGMESMLRMNIT